MNQPKDLKMSDFLKDFLPTFALMMVPFFIPIVAVALGALRDAVTRENRVETVEDRVRSLRAQRDAAAARPAFDAA